MSRPQPPNPNAPMIEVHDLRKIYHAGDVDVYALRGVDLTVERGEFLSVVGPSGSGKSTLFHILGGLMKPTSGAVRVDGRDLMAMSDRDRTDLRKKTVGFVFQKYNLLPILSATENITRARSIAGMPVAFPEGFERILKLLGIGHRLNHKPRALSGGEQQRVAIARALVNQPALLLADEPTGNLDTENSLIVLRLLKQLNEEFGQTVLMITHNPEAAAYGHRTLTMRDGRIYDGVHSGQSSGELPVVHGPSRT